MAIAPSLPASDAADLVNMQEIVTLLRPTPYPQSESTIRRWVKRYDIPVVRRRGKCFMSFTDILEAQRDEVDRLHGDV